MADDLNQLKENVVEAVREYLLAYNAAEPDDVVASMMICLRLASPHYTSEPYRSAVIEGTFAEAAGLASYGAAYFTGAMSGATQ